MNAAITSIELKDTLTKNRNVRVIDVRRKADFDKSPKTIAGAVWQDPENVGEWSKALAKDENLIVYCLRGGSVSQGVANALKASHPNVQFLEGGIVGWNEAQK